MTDFYGEPLREESVTVPLVEGHLKGMIHMIQGTCRSTDPLTR
jgi:hypothetical protein